VSLPVMLLFIGFAYVVLIGALSLLKREELSTQFALEAVVLTLVFSGLAKFAMIAIHPVLFLFVVYLITMRVRLVVDIGTIFAKRRQFEMAERFFNLAMHLFPDRPGWQAVRINQGVALLQSGDLECAVAAFTEILESINHSQTGAKLEAAAHYNLGVAYFRQQKDAQATVEFNVVIDSWPATEYARRASANLERYRQKGTQKET
jgi:tetratricopeptide (TPR) repeat protein